MGREPSLSELSRETGISPEDIAFAETATGPAESLHRESGEDGFTLELVLGDYGAEEKMVEHVAPACRNRVSSGAGNGRWWLCAITTA